MGYYVVISPMDLQCLSHWPRLLQLNVHQFVRMLTDVCTYTVHYTLSAYRRVGLFFVLERILLFFATPNPVDLCCYAITIFFFFSNVVQLLDPLLLWVFSIFFFLFLSLMLLYTVCTRTNIFYTDTCLRWYACDHFMVRAYEGIAVNFITSNEHYLCVCVCVSLLVHPIFICCGNSFSLSIR